MLFPNYVKRILIAFLLYMPVSLFADSSPCSRPLSVGWENYPPLQMEENAQVTGFDIELVKLMLGNLGCPIEFKQMAWKRQLAEAKAGKLDIVLSAIKELDREEYLTFLTPLYKNTNALYMPKKNPNKASIKHLLDIQNIANFKLGIVNGYGYGPEFENALKNQAFSDKIRINLKYESLVLMALQNKIDGFLGEEIVCDALLKKMKLDNQYDLIPIASTADTYAYITYSKASIPLALAKKIDEEQRKLLINGKALELLSAFLSREKAKEALYHPTKKAL